MRHALLAALLLAPALLAPAASLRAQASPPRPQAAALAAPAAVDSTGIDPTAGIVRLDLLPGWRLADGRRMAGLRLTLAPGWHTYWRSPGEGGLPPRLDFAASTGISGMEALWPVPEVFHLGDLRSIGYTGTVTIPLALSLTGAPARLQGTLEIGVCEEICVPVTLPVALDLPEGEGRRDPAIAAALVDQPTEATGARCVVTPGADGATLTLALPAPPQGGEEAVVVESPDPSLWLSESASHRDGATLTATLTAQARDGGPVALDRSALRITVVGDGRSVDFRGCEAG